MFEALVADIEAVVFEALVADIDAVEVRGLGRAALCDVTAGVARIRAAVDALESRTAAAIDGLGDDGPGAASVLRSVGRCSQREADRRATRSAALAEMPRTTQALRSGAITAEHADALVRAAAATSPSAVDGSELVHTAARRPADLAARDARDWTQRHEAAHSVRERHLRLRAARRLSIFDGDNGMTVLHAEFDPVTGAQIRAAVDSEANRLFDADGGRGEADKIRTPDQRRVDALALLLGARPPGPAADTADTDTADTDASAHHDPVRGGHPGSTGRVTGRNQIVIVAHSDVVTGAGPGGRCEMPGVGPIPISELERLSCDADLFGILFSGNGDPLWHGRNHRSVTPAQWRALVARDRGCVLCDKPPWRCEAHHIIAWRPPRRGPTDIDNLVLLCSHHHHQIHDHGWQLTRGPGGEWRCDAESGGRHP